MGDSASVIPVEQIEPRILLIRGQRVILAADLATIYGVETKRLNEQVRRNAKRFPGDFMFQLSDAEFADLKSQNLISGDGRTALRSQIAILKAHSLRSQNATLKRGRHAKYPPYAFTGHGALMAASVLNTPRAMDVSVYVIRAFVKLRELLSTHKELAGKVAELERKVGSHDESIQSLVAAIRRLMEPPPATARPRIGFHAKLEGRS
ncbi:MAG: ORF6N domain-containing protein [Thermoguttaceae bacterium]|jgi:hypothetical protein